MRELKKKEFNIVGYDDQVSVSITFLEIDVYQLKKRSRAVSSSQIAYIQVGKQYRWQLYGSFLQEKSNTETETTL
jgi:hypothetical protein